jgi:hypothetical protein
MGVCSDMVVVVGLGIMVMGIVDIFLLSLLAAVSEKSTDCDFVNRL